MERAKVIVHMYISIDGKIDDKYASSISEQYYNDELFRLSNADANGRRTIQMYAAPDQVDLAKYDSSGIVYEDWLPEIKSETWSIAFDRKGKCGWNKNYFAYHNHKMHAVEVVTRKASKNYLAFLQAMQIPYIVSGEAEFDLPSVLIKLKEHFQIDTLALCGGAQINGVFLEQHLVDEISLVVSPYVSGNSQVKTVFETSKKVGDCFKIANVKVLADGGLHLLFKKAA